MLTKLKHVLRVLKYSQCELTCYYPFRTLCGEMDMKTIVFEITFNTPKNMLLKIYCVIYDLGLTVMKIFNNVMYTSITNNAILNIS